MLIFYSILATFIGLSFGSFINSLEWRLYKEKSIWGRSYCPVCHHSIAWYDNIPLLSFIILKGRCRHCQAKISWQYPLVELVTALLFVLSFLLNYYQLITPGELLRNWLLTFALIVIFIYDLKYLTVPMLFLWPMIIISAFVNFLLGTHFLNIMLYGAVGAVFFLLQYLITKGKGIGSGDIWLGLFMGVSLASGQLLFLALTLAYFLGTIVSLILLIKNQKTLKSKLALGPFLMIGSFISLILGKNIINFFLN